MIPLFSKLVVAALAAVSIVGVTAPRPADAAPLVGPHAPGHEALPTPSADAKTHGVQPGNASMNWQQSGATVVPTTTAVRPAGISAAATATTLTR
ncbi:MAG: hypothetical protein ACTHOG_11540, partial [Marmoricola sp.]